MDLMIIIFVVSFLIIFLGAMYKKWKKFPLLNLLLQW